MLNADVPSCSCITGYNALCACFCLSLCSCPSVFVVVRMVAGRRLGVGDATRPGGHVEWRRWRHSTQLVTSYDAASGAASSTTTAAASAFTVAMTTPTMSMMMMMITIVILRHFSVRRGSHLHLPSSPPSRIEYWILKHNNNNSIIVLITVTLRSCRLVL